MSKNNQAVQAEIKNELKVYQGPLPPPNIMKDYEKVRAGTSAAICGYLVWWKIKEVEKDRNKRE